MQPETNILFIYALVRIGLLEATIYTTPRVTSPPEIVKKQGLLFRLSVDRIVINSACV